MQKKTFQYKAAMSSGDVVTGELTASSSEGAASLLQQRGMTPLRIQPVNGESEKSSTSAQDEVRFGSRKANQSPMASPTTASMGIRRFVGNHFHFSRRISSSRDLVMFTQDLSTLLEAGVPLPRSLKIIADLGENKKFKAIILDLHDQLKEGSTFWQALEKHPTVFTPVFVNMVKAGEAGGILDTILARLGSYLEGIQELKEYLLSAMMYPLFLFITASGSVAVLLAVVAPRFAVIFSDMGVALPLSTQMMLLMGTFLRSYWWLLALLFLLLFFFVRFYTSSEVGRHKVDRLKLRVPVIGGLLKKIEISRFCRTFGTLLNSGVPILSALKMVRGVLSNVVLNEAIGDVYHQLKEGKPLSDSLVKTGFFPAIAVQMIAVGEEAGRMDNMLIRIANMYDREMKVNIKTFTSLFEPIIILLMGVVIGAMVISMLLAIFSINDIGF